VSSAAGPHFESGARTIAARRSLATARAPRTTARTTATTTTAAASIPAATAVTSAAIAVSAARLGPRLQIDDVIEVALLLRVGWRILAAHHANQAYVVGAPAHHLERLHQAREPIAIDAHLFFDLGRRAHRALVDGWWRARFRRRALGRRGLSGRLRGGLSGRLRGGLSGRLRGLSGRLRRGFALGGRSLRFDSGFGRGFGGRLRGLRGRFSRLRRFRRRFDGSRFGGLLGRACLRRVRRAGLRRRLARAGFVGRWFRGRAARLLWSRRRTMSVTDPCRLAQDGA
jgi:hypothetical protein